LPKWLTERYSLLWKTFKEKEFDHDQAASILKEEKERLVSVVLSDLKRHGWLTIKLHPEDSRKRIYSLKSPEKAMLEIANKE
jgi:hypothetical protein